LFDRDDVGRREKGVQGRTICSIVFLFFGSWKLVAVVVFDLEVKYRCFLRQVLDKLSIVVNPVLENQAAYKRTFPIAPRPTIPKVKPVGSFAGLSPGVVLHLPALMLFSALVVFLNTANKRKI
jgi:hypothetical protein